MSGINKSFNIIDRDFGFKRMRRRKNKPAVSAENKSIKLAVEHFYDSRDEDEDKDEEAYGEEKEEGTVVGGEAAGADAGDIDVEAEGADAGDAVGKAPDDINGEAPETPETAPAGAPEKMPEPYEKASAFWEYLYERTLNKKCIVFTNLRNDAETVIAMLRQIADLRGQPDIYHVHHGSISAALRETAETDLKENAGPAVISATITLEMGIDVGRLESIFQINAPNSVSSFLQRLGRSGRRGNAAEMWFLTNEQPPSGVPLPPQQIPWRLLQTVAVLQLYLEERWVESPAPIKYPLSLLYHQTMSVVAAFGEITLEALAAKTLGMAAFSHIPPEDYALLLNHLIAIGHLQRVEDGGLIIGLEGEKLTNSYKFLAVFADEENEYAIIADSRPIGRIENPPPPGERVTLAGRTWEITEIDVKRKTVFATRVRGKVQTYWRGGGNKIDGRILEKMRGALMCRDEYPYLRKNARARLSETRFFCSHSGFTEYNIFSLGGKTVCILPWTGSIDFFTILYLMRKYMGDRIDARSVGGWTPYFITAKLTGGTARDLLADFQALLRQPLHILDDITDDDIADLKGSYEYRPPKYDAFVPIELKKKAVVADFINLERLAKQVEAWKCGSLSDDAATRPGDAGTTGK